MTAGWANFNDAPSSFLTGPPGLGKTTAAARFDRAVHLESALFRFVRSGYVEPWRRESRWQNEVALGIAGASAATYSDAASSSSSA